MKIKMKKQIDAAEKRLQAKRAAIKDAEARSEKSTDVEELKRINAEIRGLNEDVDAIISELNGLKEMYGEMDEPADDGAPAGEEAAARSGNLKKVTNTRGGKPAGENAEQRAAQFAASGRMNIGNGEARAVLISGGKIATPTEVDGIKDGFNTVSSIVDQANVVDAEGMGAYEVAYEIADPEAAETAEGAEYNEDDAEFGLVKVEPKTVTVISYISKQVKKQSPLNYEEKVKTSALRALRQRASSMIVNAVKASEIAKIVPVEATTIDETTLRALALSYGGDENVAGSAVLYLNKTDLLAFGDVRGDDKKPVYEITPDVSNPNTGIIKDGGLSVKYCLNKHCAALSSATRGPEAIKTMMYGNPLNVDLALFSDYEVVVSEDFKISKGLLTIVGDAQIGSALTVKDGFVVLELAANT